MSAYRGTCSGQGGSQAELKYLKPSQSEELGFDRFGRVYRIKAQNGSTVILDYTYSYDRLGNPTQRTDSTALGKSETYRHDPTERLVALSRTGEDEKKWELTGAGNWREVTLGGAAVDTRTHNALNEIETRDPGDDPSYDLGGNTVSVPVDEGTGSFTLTYDPWNRLVAVKRGETELCRFKRDGLGRIIEDTVSGRRFYYTTSWQLISVFQGGALQKSYVWGPRYIDEILMTYVQGEGRFYHFQDANWNVVSTLNSALSETERVVYDPYGLPSFYVYSGGSYLPAGNWTSPTGADFLFQGRWYHPLQTASGDKLRLYHFRNRAYATKLGRFLQRDPLTKEQEERRPVRPYSFVEGAPLSRVDPSGLLVVADTGLRNKPGGFPRSLISTLRDICPCYSYEALPLYPWQQQT